MLRNDAMATERETAGKGPAGRRAQAGNAALFGVTLLVFGVLFFVMPSDEMSALERRMPAELPEASVEGIFDGSFAVGIERYVADRFPFRERFLELSMWVREHQGFSSGGATLYEVKEGGLEALEKPEDWADPDELSGALDDEAGDEAGADLGDDEAGADLGDDEAGADLGDDEAGGDAAGGDAAPSKTAAGGAEGGSLAPSAAPASPTAVAGAAAGHPPLSAPATPGAGARAASAAGQPDATPPGQQLAEPAAPAAAAADATDKARKRKPGRAKMHRGVLVYDGRAMQVFGGGPGMSRRYAKAINRYADALAGSKVNLYNVVMPTAAEFYLPERYPDRKIDEKRAIDIIYATLRPNVRRVDVWGELQRHKDEYLYFRTDHHWTARGAYQAYRALCKAAGIAAVPLEKMQQRQGTRRFIGTLYGYTRDRDLLKNPDHVEYFEPPAEYKAVRYARSNPKRAVDCRFLVPRGWGYGVFLGGDFPLMVADTDVANGRRVVLVKNSYGNPLAVFLLASFEKVLIVDYRYYSGSLLKLLEEHQITDLVFANGVFTAHTGYHIRRLERVMHGRKPKRGDAARQKPAAGGNAPAATGAGPAMPAPKATTR